MWGAATSRGDNATPGPSLPAHLLAGSNVCRMCLLAQRLDDRHLGKVLHRLLELGQGAAPVAFATFDVLGLCLWGGIWGGQAQNTSGMGFLSSLGDGLFGGILGAQLPPPFLVGQHQWGLQAWIITPLTLALSLVVRIAKKSRH